MIIEGNGLWVPCKFCELVNNLASQRLVIHGPLSPDSRLRQFPGPLPAEDCARNARPGLSRLTAHLDRSARLYGPFLRGTRTVNGQANASAGRLIFYSSCLVTFQKHSMPLSPRYV